MLSTQFFKPGRFLGDLSETARVRRTRLSFVIIWQGAMRSKVGSNLTVATELPHGYLFVQSNLQGVFDED